MVVLLTGSTGMIGRNIKEQMDISLSPTREELDLRDADKVRKYLKATKPDKIIHCASNDNDVCLYDNLRMFHNLAESHIPMVTFCTGREIEDRTYKNGEYVFSKYLCKELALNKYINVDVIQLWGCFGKYERDIRFFRGNMINVLNDRPIEVWKDMLFSYVYVDDVIDILRRYDWQGLLRVVAYTMVLSNYAKYLKEVTGSPYDIIIKDSNINHSYVGKNSAIYPYRSLENCLEKMWEEFKEEYSTHT